MAFSFDSRIRYSEVDSSCRLSLTGLTNYFQDCSVFHSQSHDVGIRFLADNHIAWVLSSWQICINRLPLLNEQVKISTWAYGMKAFYGYRNFTLEDAGGSTLAYANSVWVLVDTRTGRPVKVPQEFADTYGLEPQLEMECAKRKLHIPDDMEKKGEIEATRYPTVKDFWFDGTWDESIKKNGWWTAHAERMLKELIPGVTVNSRLRADDYGKRHFDSNGHLMGDYESAYERRLPDPVKDLQVTKWDWEACMTLPENQWGYHKDWSLSYVKNPVEVLERIVHAVSMGGNMVVNFGPQADGDFRTEEKEIAKAIGKWMQKNGECIYACDYAGWEKQDWGYYTRKKNSVYMIVFNRPYSKQLTVKVPKETQIINAVLLNGEKMKVTETARNEYNVGVPKQDFQEPFVIKLEIKSSKTSTNKYHEALT